MGDFAKCKYSAEERGHKIDPTDPFYSNQGGAGTCTRHAVAKALLLEVRGYTDVNFHVDNIVSLLINAVRAGGDGAWPSSYDNQDIQVDADDGNVYELKWAVKELPREQLLEGWPGHIAVVDLREVMESGYFTEEEMEEAQKHSMFIRDWDDEHIICQNSWGEKYKKMWIPRDQVEKTWYCSLKEVTYCKTDSPWKKIFPRGLGHPSDGLYTVKNEHSSKFLNVNGGSKEEKAKVQQWFADGAQDWEENQWYFDRVPGTERFFLILNKKSCRVLGVPETGDGNGAQVLQLGFAPEEESLKRCLQPCQYNKKEQRAAEMRAMVWEVIIEKHLGDGRMECSIRNAHSKRFLNVLGNGTQNGDPVGQWGKLLEDAEDWPANRWILERIH